MAELFVQNLRLIHDKIPIDYHEHCNIRQIINDGINDLQFASGDAVPYIYGQTKIKIKNLLPEYGSGWANFIYELLKK